MCDTLSQNQINTFLNQTNSLILTKDCTDDTPKDQNLDVKLEEDRLKTFKEVVHNSSDFAKLGFYYTNNILKCAYCAVERDLSAFGDDILSDHLRYSPSCPFARAKKGERTLNTFLKALPEDKDVCGNVDTFSDSVRILSKFVQSYDEYEARLESFKNWPESAKQKPQRLAAAGFFYKGIGDKTVCFECNGPLNNWEEEDDVWEQHAFWFPNCTFVLKEKGRDFVVDVQKRLKTFSAEQNEEGKSCDEDKMCVVCCNRQKEVVFVPCGHDWTCLQCVKALDDKKCPICREQIVQIRYL